MTLKKWFYKLIWSDDEIGGVAYSHNSFELRLDPNQELLSNWNIPKFQLRDGSFTDYLANDSGLPMCSAKMKAVIDKIRDSSDLVEWLPVQIEPIQPSLPGIYEEDSNINHFYIPHLLEELDVVDVNHSVVDSLEPLLVIKPYFDLGRIGTHQFFRYKGGGDITVCVSNKIRLTLLEWNCTGCYFAEIASN